MGVAIGAPHRPDPGIVLLREGLAREALPFLERSHEKEPDDWEHLSNLGVAHRIMGEFAQAKDFLKQALRLSPNSAVVWSNFGMLLDDLGDFKDSLEAYRQAFTINPSNQVICLNYATALLRFGNYQEGWPLWEFGRYQRSYFLPEIPLWARQPLSGKRIVVLKEGGYGDMFLFMRYFYRLKRMGAHVTAYVWNRLESLMTGHPWVDNVVTQSEGLGVNYDYCVPLMSLPAVLDEPMNVEFLAGYIRSEAAPHKGRRVGIAWQAEERGCPRRTRSLDDRDIEPLNKVNAEWVSLQKGKSLLWMNDEDDAQSDWKATARLIQGLDLVIACDTAVANLAGAMGKPVWILLPLNSEWKWGLAGSDTPLYPTARLFRSREHGWGKVIQEVVEALKVRL